MEGVVNDLDEEGMPRFPTLRELAEKHGAHYSQVRAESARGHWQELKLNHMQEVAEQRRRDRKKVLTAEAEAFDDVSLRTAKLGKQLVLARLGEKAKFVQATARQREDVLQRLQDGQPVSREEMRSVINYKELSELAQAAKLFDELGRSAMGIDVERVEVTGPEGGPVQVSVQAELRRDDPDRVASFLEVFQRAGVLPDVVEHLAAISPPEVAPPSPFDGMDEQEGAPVHDDNVIDAEVL